MRAAWNSARARSAPAASSRARHDHAINDNLNKRLDRSEFMPFAPFVLEEDAERVFEITTSIATRRAS